MADNCCVYAAENYARYSVLHGLLHESAWLKVTDSSILA